MVGKIYSLLCSLLTPEKPASKIFKELVKIVQEHLVPKPLVIPKRFRLHKSNQLEGESVSSLVTVMEIV